MPGRSREGPSITRENIAVSLYMAERTSYTSLRLTDQVFPYWTLSHVHTGKVLTTTGGEEYLMRAGEVMIHPPNITFAEFSAESGIHEWLQFDARPHANVDLLAIFPISLMVKLRYPAEFSRTFQHLLMHWAAIGSPFRSLTASGEVIKLLGMVLEDWREAGSVPRNRTGESKESRFAAVIGYMMDHYDKKLSRDDLASMLHLHPVYFDRLFLNSYGMTPMAMLREIRLRRVKQLLEGSDMPLSAIAHNCGLGDAAHLSRLFVKAYGENPGEYRERVRRSLRSYLSSSAPEGW